MTEALRFGLVIASTVVLGIAAAPIFLPTLGLRWRLAQGALAAAAARAAAPAVFLAWGLAAEVCRPSLLRLTAEGAAGIARPCRSVTPNPVRFGLPGCFGPGKLPLLSPHLPAWHQTSHGTANCSDERAWDQCWLEKSVNSDDCLVKILIA